VATAGREPKERARWSGVFLDGEYRYSVDVSTESCQAPYGRDGAP